MSRQTKKYMYGIRVLAEMLGCKALDLTRAYTNQEIYAELRSLGFEWVQSMQAWQKSGVKPAEQPASTYTAVPAKIRVMGDTEIDTEVAAKAIMAALEDAGYTVTQVSPVAKNRGSEGARQYFDILL